MSKSTLPVVAVTVALGACFASGAAQAPAERQISIDLQPQTNQKLSDTFGSGREGNTLAAVPAGEQTFEGVKFRIGEGLVHLGSDLLKVPRPDVVKGIKVGRAFSKLYLLHGTGYGNGRVIGQPGQPGDALFVADGTRIAEYRLHYDDGGMEIIPVVYGRDVRDWWFTPGAKGADKGKVAWTGDNDLAKSFGSQLRLFLGTWENPRPDKVVVTIDFVKMKDTPAAPFCVALTVDDTSPAPQ